MTALLVLLAVVWSGYALWDNSRVYAAADNVQAGLLAFKPQPQEDNSLSFGQLRDINPMSAVADGWTARPSTTRWCRARAISPI